jgi:hypothetical protein
MVTTPEVPETEVNELVDESMVDDDTVDKEKLAECFLTCGQVADWLGKDFPDKKPGLSGEKTKDRLRDAINKISGVTKVA